jgi:endonuclease YncB( thermonuclease family)
VYEYGARLVRIIDADTWVVDIDLGMHIWMLTVKVRGSRIDAPELIDGPAWQAAREWVAVWFAEHCPEQKFTLKTVLDRPDKYGRVLGTVLAPDGHVLNDDLIVSGHAEAY